jgi:hypothetical protein
MTENSNDVQNDDLNDECFCHIMLDALRKEYERKSKSYIDRLAEIKKEIEDLNNQKE